MDWFNLYPFPDTQTSFPVDDLFAMIHVMAKVYKPWESKCPGLEPFVCFIKAITEMLPPGQLKRYWDVYLMKYPVNVNDLPGWAYNLHKYISTNVYQTNFLSKERFNQLYDIKNIKITTWSHPTWKMIHYFAVLMDQGTENSRMNKYDESPNKYFILYKAFVSCLQYLLPCPKCRDHLHNNLVDNIIDKKSADLFTWSCNLHNVVNTQLKKPVMKCSDARELYGLV